MKALTLTILLTSYTIIGLGQNLISNSSFESNMQLNCQSWYDECGNELINQCDSTSVYCQAGFYQDSPLNIPEELWCLKLTASMLPGEGLAETYITGQSDTNIYKLEFWMKSPDWIGSASIGIISQNQFTANKTIADTTSIWKKFTLIDTISTQATDTIAVHLSAGSGDFCICTSYFDLIDLTILDAVTTIENINLSKNEHIKVYPNPSISQINIELKSLPADRYQIDLYSIVGQKIKTVKTEKKIISINISGLSEGVYFITVTNTRGGLWTKIIVINAP